MGLLMVSTLIKHALMLTNDLLIGHVSTSIVRDLRMRVFDSALAMDRKTYQAYGTSGLLAAITAAADGLTAGLIHLFGAAIREHGQLDQLASAFALAGSGSGSGGHRGLFQS